jgi:hypothetical protein
VLLVGAFSRSAAGKLAAGECGCRDTGDDEGRRNHEGDDQLTHVSCLRKGFGMVQSVLPCKRGIAPRIAIVEHGLLYIARAMPTCA